jgi:hypothetical protein
VKIRLYIDEDSMRRALVIALEARGIDVQTALDAHLVAQPDEKHLQHATEQQRVLYSFNIGDYCQLHSGWLAAGRSHGGIVLARQTQFSVGEQLRRLLQLISKNTAEEMANQLVFLSGHD